MGTCIQSGISHQRVKLNVMVVPSKIFFINSKLILVKAVAKVSIQLRLQVDVKMKLLRFFKVEQLEHLGYPMFIFSETVSDHC